MSRRSLSILLVLLAVIATGVVWLAGEIGESAAGTSATTEIADRSREGDESRAPAAPQLADLPREGTLRALPVEPAPPVRERVGAAAPDFDPELASAIWVDGRVVFPRGTPADEHVVVVAEGASFESRDFHRVSPGPDGSFRVAFARGTGMGVLRLEGRYLYLKSYRTLSLPTKESEIVLRPLLGGCIRGRVLLPLSGNTSRTSIVGCAVSVFTNSEQPNFQPPKQEVLVTTKVDEELQFEIGGVPSVEACSVALRSSEVSVPDPVDVQVEPGRVTIVDLLVEANARISGVVLDADGQPDGGSTVRVRRTDRSSEHFALDRPTAETHTSSEGRFELAGLAAGAYQVWADAPHAVNSVPTDLELAPGQTIPDLTLRLSRGGRIVGQVIDAEGGPDPAVQVRASSSGGRGSVSTNADSQGRFELGKLVPGEYELWTGHHRPSAAAGPNAITISSRSTAVHVEDGQTVEVVIGGPSAESVVVQGRVHHGGKPAAGWRVTAERFGGRGRGARSTTCDAQGAYRLVLDAPGWSNFHLGPAENTATLSETVEIPAVPTFERDFELAGRGRLAGRVVDGSGAAAPNVSVTASPVGGEGRFGERSFFGQVTTDALGSFAFGELSAGTYTLEATRGSIFDNEPGSGRATVEGIRLGEGESVEGLVLTIQECCSVEVSLRRADGEAVPAASVTAPGQGSIGTSHSRSNRSSSKSTWCVLKGLRPGEVTVTANTQDPPLAGRATVVLAPGKKGKVEILLQPATTLLVRLEAPGRDPRDALVVVRDPQGGVVVGQARLGRLGAEPAGLADSQRRFGPLVAGRYTILAEHPDGSTATTEVEITGGTQQVVSLRLEP